MAAPTNIYGFNIGGNNNSFDQRGHFYRAFLDGNVSGMLVKQNSTPNMTVLVEHGSALLNKNTTSASIAEVKSNTSVTIDTANTSNPRIDTVVIYEDTSVAIPTVEVNYWQDGAGGRFKIVSLPGTAAASPVALSDASIQTAIGAGKPWTRLADITVPTNSTTILNSNIADKRSQMGGTIPDKSVTAQKIDFTTGIWGEVIGRSNPLSTPGDTITVSSLPARKYLTVIVNVTNSGAIDPGMTFNGDTANNYALRVSNNGGADSTSVSRGNWTWMVAGGSFPSSAIINIKNIATLEKIGKIEGWEQNTAGAANAPQRTERIGKWANTTSQISSITLTNNGAGDFAVGSEVIVHGHD